MASVTRIEGMSICPESKQAVQNIIRNGVSSGVIQRSNEGNPFTLLVNEGCAALLREHGLHLSAAPPCAGTGNYPVSLTQQVEWEDSDPSKGAFSFYGLLRFYDNNMDTLMQALSGIHLARLEVLQSGVPVRQILYAGRTAANEGLSTRPR